MESSESQSGGAQHGGHGSSVLVPCMGLVVCVVAWGTFAIPMKLKQVYDANLSPIIFQMYMSVGIMLSSWAVLLWEPWDFTFWAIPAAFIWTLGSILSVQVINDIGMSVGQGVWSGFVALTAFLWGTFGHAVFPRNFPRPQMRDEGLATFGLAGLILGVLGLSLVGKLSDPKPGAASKDSVGRGIGGAARRPDMNASLLPAESSINRGYSPKRGAGRESVVRGLTCAVLVGLAAGSTLVPMKMAPKDPFQVTARSAVWAVSFGIVIVPVTLIFVALGYMYAVENGLPPPRLHARACALPGIASGILWNCGNIGSIYAQSQPLGYAVGYPVTQSCVLVAGAIGIVCFGELRGVKAILGWLLAAVLLLTGAAALGYFGSSN